MAGQGLGGGEVAAGQAGRAGFLAEYRDAGSLAFRLGPASFGDVGGDGEGGAPGQPFDLVPGLAGEVAEDQGFSAGGFVLVEGFERSGR